MAKFEITSPADKEYIFTLVNGKVKVLLESDIYDSKSSCRKGIESVKTNCKERTNFHKVKADDGTWTYYLLGPDGKPVGHSGTFATEEEMNQCIDSMIRESERAEIEDKTAEAA